MTALRSRDREVAAKRRRLFCTFLKHCGEGSEVPFCFWLWPFALLGGMMRKSLMEKP